MEVYVHLLGEVANCSTPACPYRRFPLLCFAFAPLGCIMQCNLRTTQGNVFDREVTLVGKQIGRTSVRQP